MENEWEKFWTVDLSLTMASMLGHLYTEHFPAQGFHRFSEARIFRTQGNTTCYLKKQDRKAFAQDVIKRFAQDQNTIKKFCIELKEKMEELRTTAAKFTINDYEHLRKVFFEYNIYHVTPRHIADFSGKFDDFKEDLTKARLAGETIHQEVDKKIKEVLGQHIGVAPEEAGNMIDGELDSLNKQKLAERSSFTALVITPDETKVLCDEPAKELFDQTLNIKERGFVQGTVAFKGKAKGKVRIIMNPFEQDLEEGDILVTGMTRPDFLPQMKKAGAIVTDAGGMLCHAAIVAREMAKPCIIGTQTATQVFKDGDLVEVDAVKGIMRKR